MHIGHDRLGQHSPFLRILSLLHLPFLASAAFAARWFFLVGARGGGR
jgi:hypothetical protein